MSRTSEYAALCSMSAKIRNMRYLVIYILVYFFCYRKTFFGLVKEACQNHFKQNIDKVLSHLSQSGKIEDENIRSLIFGDYMDTESAVRIYDEVRDLKELTTNIDQ